MKAAYDMVVMGDINLDWRVRGPLTYPFRALVINGNEWMPIDELPGGTGLNFARFAQEAGYVPLLLGKIGDDPAGSVIHEWLQQRGLELGVSRTTAFGTGKAFIVRDSNDIRFLVNNTPNANRDLSVSDIRPYDDLIESCQFLYISGYCAYDPAAPRKLTTIKALELARRGARTYTIFDVVPHRFYERYSWCEFRELTRDVDILISEAATMRRFLAMGHKDEVITRQEAERTAEKLKAFYDRFVLRFGPSGCDEQVTWDAWSRSLTWEETGHRHAPDKRGYGDRLTIRALKATFQLRSVSA